VPVSAITKQGVDTLLEAILMQAEMLELKANPNKPPHGVVLEATLDKARAGGDGARAGGHPAAR